jgi:hypothetical protein
MKLFCMYLWDNICAACGMRRVLGLLVFVSLIMACIESGAYVYDLKTDWSDISNPNGVWTIKYNAVTLSSSGAEDLGFDASQSAWRNDFLPAFVKNNGSYTNGYPFETFAGDIIVHTYGGFNGGSDAGANIKWQSPSDGFATISGGVWEVNSLGRTNHWELYHNGLSLSGGNVFDGDAASRDNPFQFANGSEGIAAVSSIPVRRGDVISLNLSNVSQSGDFVGVNLSVNLTEEWSTFVQIDPRSTYLKPLSDQDQEPFAVEAGDWLKLSAVGEFKFTQANPQPDPNTLRNAFGVFSSSSDLDDKLVTNRVPDAVSVVEGNNFSEVVSNPANDIPGDFLIPTQSDVPGAVLVRVPVGATHLFVGAADTQWWDNSDVDENYGVSITRIYSGRFLGDYNFNGVVDAADYTVWRDLLGEGGVALEADGNLDGFVNEQDYSIWKEHFGQTVPASGSASAANIAVPEPSSVALAAACAILATGFSIRRRAGA